MRNLDVLGRILGFRGQKRKSGDREKGNIISAIKIQTILSGWDGKLRKLYFEELDN